MTLVFLRVSVGSCAFLASMKPGKRELHAMLVPLYNQMRLLHLLTTGKLLVGYDSTDSSLFRLITKSEEAKKFTEFLHKRELLRSTACYLTPSSVKGTVEGNSVAGKKKASEMGKKYGPIYGPIQGAANVASGHIAALGKKHGPIQGAANVASGALDAALGGRNSAAVQADRPITVSSYGKFELQHIRFSLNDNEWTCPDEWTHVQSASEAGRLAADLGTIHTFGPSLCGQLPPQLTLKKRRI